MKKKIENTEDLKTQIKLVGVLRDLLHNLDPNNESNMKIYKQIRYDFFSEGEGSKLRAYLDTEGKITIGIGFNMEAEGARDAWNEVLRGEVDFDAAMKGKVSLTKKQIDALFNHSIETREKYLRTRVYPGIFDKLRLNERLALEDLHFNGPNLVRGPTKNKPATQFYIHMHEYYRTGDEEHLKKAVDEVKLRSNPDKSTGLQNRRNKQAELLSSYKCPFFSKTSDNRFPYTKDSKIRVKIGETVIPRLTESWPGNEDNRYFIWRTNCDNKVRNSHMILEGKVFDRNVPPAVGMPKEDYNCRCYEEKLPTNIEVIEEHEAVKRHKWFNINIDIFVLKIHELDNKFARLWSYEK